LKKDGNFLVLTERFFPEEFLINELVLEWKRKGADITILTQVPTYPFGKVFKNHKNKFFGSELWNGIKIKRFFSITGYRENRIKKAISFINYTVWSSLYCIFRGYKYEKIFIYQVGSLTVAIPALFLKLFYRKNITIWTQDIWPDSVSPNGFTTIRGKIFLFFIEILVTIVYRNVNNIAVSCEPFINVIKKYSPQTNIIYLPNWASLEDYEFVKMEKLSDKVNFTFAGNINKFRNLAPIIEAFAKFNFSFKNAQLNIIGDGSGLDTLKTITKQKEIDNVKFWGRIPSSQISRFYKGSDFLIISLSQQPCYSLYLPAKFSTYLQTGKPILAVMNGAVPQIMDRCFLGVSVTPTNIDNIADAFLSISKISFHEKECIKENAAILLENEFNKISIINQLFELASE